MSVHTPNTTDDRSIAPRLTLANSVLQLEDGPAGPVARIDHRDGSVGYAGPLDAATIAALREVSR